MKQIVILISGTGSNMRAIADACAGQAWPARIDAVISSRPGAAGLLAAQERGIPTAVVDAACHGSRESFDAALDAAIQAFQPDLLVLAGFMRILTPAFVARYEGRMVNVHPSLLPAFPGLKTHERALAAGCKWAGATVHLVTAELDHGPILAQAAVPVLPEDTPATLAARVLAREHHIYPLAVRWLVEDRLQITQGLARHLDGVPQYFD
jgi:phosphoribosylglycinamide formyltransferase 1